ncbi:membrane protein insertase YidC [Thiolapillus brandeum]|uniref:Membrane protein insertase YidC n=1 Tax=Thiolapillus brandeum TaxID=1076588 RepID=A0A7U6GLB2_9GAMM|nr:membrane protein insertase YidC [Thiolapillus brandeum]BAO45761.1 preprotein translocase subunit YidC [Thiolapillus brandeum]
MDNIRLFLIMALAYTGYLLWQAWQDDYATPVPQAQTVQQSTVDKADQSVPQVPEVAAIDGATPQTSGMKAADPAAASGKIVTITTDTLKVSIDTRGGSIVETLLLKYPVSIKQPDVKYRLMSRSPEDFFIAQSGLLGGEGVEAPNHEAVFTATQNAYTLGEGKDELNVDLVWTGSNGVKVTKRYHFVRGSHKVDLENIVENGSSAPWQVREYRQLQRGEPAKKNRKGMMSRAFVGGVAWDPEDKYQKYDFDDLKAGKLNKEVTGGWIAMIQHYFLAAEIPPKTEPRHFYSKGLANGHYVIGEYTPAVSVAPGSRHVFQGAIYMGPKDQDTLESIAEGLELVVDYGWLTLLAKPMYQILSWINSVVGNWGWTIIIFTILIKAVFFKLSEASYRSMAKMRNLTPRIQALKDRYGDDKQRMQAAMMEIYKKEKINPLGGCLPMLIQMPFFIALYWVLMESVELRQAPWILWIKDLSIMDPYYVLPVIMGISMFIQQKLNPAPPDPMQAKLMMALPFVFTIMFAFFPSGLVLYWVMNNILSIAQQWVITKRIEEQAKAA